MSKFKTFCESILEEKSSEDIVAEIFNMKMADYVKLNKDEKDKIEQDCKKISLLVDQLIETETPRAKNASALDPWKVTPIIARSVLFNPPSALRIYILRKNIAGEIIGIGWVENLDNIKPDLQFLSTFVIDKNYRGTGDGKFFLEEIIRLEKKRNPQFTKLFLDVYAAETAKFYEKLGFKSMGEVVFDWTDKKYIRMEKTV